MQQLAWRFVEWLASFSARPDDEGDEVLRKGVLTLFGLSIVLGVPSDFATILRAGDHTAAAMLACVWLVAVAGFGHFVATKRRGLFQSCLFVMLAVAPISGHLRAGGFKGAGPLVFWTALVPFAAMLLATRGQAVAWLVGYMVAVTALVGMDPHLAAPKVPLPADTMQYLWGSVLTGFTATIFLIMFYFVTRLQEARAELAEKHRLLDIERKKSEKLLLNILPAPIAARLKETEETIAEGFAEVTVLFADLVGFTQLSSQVPAERLVTMLNRVFSAFDALAERHGVEKIKTIGDAYMAAAGLPDGSSVHAELIARMALDMQVALADANRELGLELQARIGINTGPVVAGVIGTHRFIYDLWGDTVNIASRMESTGQPGRIQVTAATFERLKHAYRFEPRGEISVKGKGTLSTYFLVGPPAPQAGEPGVAAGGFSSAAAPPSGMR